MKPASLILLLTILSAFVGCDRHADQAQALQSGHPNLVMTRAGVDTIRSALGSVPLLDATIADVQAEVDAEIAAGIDTPIPQDYSGGYTHERHKRNFFVIQKAGALYQILDDERYAKYVRDMLFQYEAMYKDLPLHPKTRSYARGKLFWQCLNDANWLVYVSQAYDAVYDFLTAEERDTLENNLFRPFADHLSIKNPRFFNRIHNHSTWGNAAVGMIGLVMGDDELVDRALYGLSPEQFDMDPQLKDDDGGFIFDQDGRAGFLANLDEPFSPDGYHTEGPYYQRYAMYPFLIFAQGLHNVRPDLNIFDYNDGVLIKGVNAMLQLSDADGDFFPLNDGQKGMSYYTDAVVSAVNIAYLVGNDPQLLGVAEEQGKVLLDDAGVTVAVAIRDGQSRPFEKVSVNLSDGSKGEQGGIAVLRDGDEQLELVFKYAAQGLSHGHYDKLSYSFYEKGDEVLQDYGLARFVNIEQKGGGNYLPENTSWAKQTIAHNTLTLDGASHYGGRYEIGSQHHPELHFFADEKVRIASASEGDAYPGTMLHRTVALIEHDSFEKPLVLDIFKTLTDERHRYDLPFYYLGQIIDTNFEYESPASLAALGEQNGYQHLYVEGRGSPSTDTVRFSWMENRRFYTLTSVAADDDEILLTRIGANDPDFNLRRDPAIMLRRNDTAGTLFVSTIESHGEYSPVTELAVNARSSVANLSVLYDDDDYSVISVEAADGRQIILAIANEDATDESRHRVVLDSFELDWWGPYGFFGGT